jgi:hypothetical protein
MPIAVVDEKKLGLAVFSLCNIVPKALQSLSGLVNILQRPRKGECFS